MQLHGSSTGATTGPTQITHVSLSILPPLRAAVASRLSVACRAPQARLCDFQCFFWHGFPQYQARWHCEQRILAPSDWQWKQRWVSSDAAAPFPLPFLPVLQAFAFLVGSVVTELPVFVLAVAAAEAPVGEGAPPSDAASDASRAPSPAFRGGMPSLACALLYK